MTPRRVVERYALHAVVAGILVVGAFALRGRHTPPATPEATVSALFDAAGQGDVDAYLRLLGRDLRESLEQARSERGDEVFAEELRRSAKGVKGLAVTRLGEDTSGGVDLEVEIVFADKNERQKMILRPEDGGWIVDSMEAAQGVQPVVPYGTPVFEVGEADRTGGRTPDQE